MDVRTLMWICALLTLQYKPTVSQDAPRDEYTADRKYYKINQNLTSIPTDIPTDALEVYIQDNTIQKIEANAFSNLSKCEKLRLERNKINEVEPGAWNGLTALDWLWIDYNDLKALYANMFSNLGNCTVLVLQYNPISEIEPGSFNGLSNLETLTLISNPLTTVNAGTFQGLEGLGILFLVNNAIDSIEENTFANLKKLGHLWLSENVLETIKPGIFFGLDSLQYLHLQHNHLKTLTAESFSTLVSLQYLDLNHNFIETLTAGTFSGLDFLTYLDLHSNYLEALTAGSFSGLKSLQQLLLYGNYLTLLPADVFSHLPRPFKLALHDADKNSAGDNPLQCNAQLCWLKQEELRGNITWVFSDRRLPYKPKCVNGIDWDTWKCDLTVTQTKPPISSTSTTGEELVTSVEETITTTTEQDVNVNDTTDYQPKDDKLKWIFIAVGVAATSIIMSIVIIVICLRRHCIKVCCAKRTGTPDDNMRVDIVANEEPMATEDDIGYEDLPADTYATIGESSIAKRNDDAEIHCHGEVEVTPYNDPDPLHAENLYHGNVDVKTYTDDVPAPFETRF